MSLSATRPAARSERVAPHGRIILAACLGSASVCWAAGAQAGLRQSALAVVGFAAGVALCHGAFTVAVGLDVAWPYWSGDPALDASVFADVTSVMNFGLMLGVLTASAAAGRFDLGRGRLSWRGLVSAVLGGFLMGLGARLASGCNIGAFFSGAASGSAHAPVWLALALAGSALGVRLRPYFHLDR